MVVEKIKFLGVQIDQNLEWKEHINMSRQKLRELSDSSSLM